MKATNLIFIFLILFISSANAEIPNQLQGKWVLQIMDLQHKVIATLSIRFTDKKAESCLGGNWLQVLVDDRKTSDENFFPINDSLSYELNANKLSIGRNEICDAYLQLKGELTNSNASGEFVSFGWGSEQIGFFTLSRGSK